MEFVRIYDAPTATSDEEGKDEYLTVTESIVKGLIGEDAKIRWEESDEAFHLVDEAFNDLQMKLGEQVLDLARGGRLTDAVSLRPEEFIRNCDVLF